MVQLEGSKKGKMACHQNPVDVQQIKNATNGEQIVGNEEVVDIALL